MLDAGILIAHLDGHDEHHSRAGRFLESVASEAFGVSPLTLAEVLVPPTQQGRAEDAHAALRGVRVITIALDDASPTRLAELRVATRLKLPDCCVLLAAEQAGAEVATFDDALAASTHRLGLPLRPC